MKLKFPIGIQSFKEIRTGNYYYVDKTPFVKKLVDSGKFFFLSRPRRFGKSLFLDTLRQAFLGRKELFSGLYLEKNWDWEKVYPVISISFGSGVIKKPETLEKKIESVISDHAEAYKISLKKELLSDRFQELIIKLAEKFNQKVVVLVDEYDKPILDNVENKEVAIEMREILKNFYSVLKDADPYLKFAFITGVSKFSKVSLFSGLNNLNDITLDEEYGTICGYTQEEFEVVFADVLEGIDLEEVKRWYNGYSWLSEPVYNPFDILLFLQKKDFRPFWFETATPSFLIKLLFKKEFYLPCFEDMEAGDELLNSFDVDEIELEPLLFQTGYMTIKWVEKLGDLKIYHLSYPNLEVKSALNRHILTKIVGSISKKDRQLIEIYRVLLGGEVGKLKEIFYSVFAGIPKDWFRKNDIAEYEGFYGSVIYAYFCALGLDVKVEDATNVGKLDMAVFVKDRCFLFEFKMVKDKAEGKALSQLKEKKYYEKYKNKCKEIYLIGIEFSKKERNIINFEWEKI